MLRSLDKKSKIALANADVVILNDLIATSLEIVHNKTNIPEKKLSTIRNEAEKIINLPKE